MQAIAHWIAQTLVVSGDVAAFDAKVLVLGKNASVVFGERTIYIQRGQQP